MTIDNFNKKIVLILSALILSNFFLLTISVTELFVKINYPDLIHISALSAFIGHVFPIWMKFKGGKGVATYVGILFCMSLNLGIVFIILG